MSTIRRCYLYAVLSVALILLLFGLPDLVRLGIDALAGRVRLGTGQSRDELSRALAFTIVAAPLWLAHAQAIRRAVAGDGSAAHAERGAVTRSIALMATLVVLAAIAGWSGFLIVHELTVAGFDIPRDRWAMEDLPERLSWLVVTSGMAIPYLRWRVADHRVAHERLGDDVGDRIATYGLLLGAAAIGLLAARDLVAALVELAVHGTWTVAAEDRKSTRLNSSHSQQSRMPSSA